MRRLIFALGCLLVLGACGSGDGDEPFDAGTATSGTRGVESGANGDIARIESPDGLVSIEIGSSSLPDGVTIDDISVAGVMFDGGDDGLPLMAASLEPHGLLLSAPATVTMTLPAGVDGEIVTVHQFGGHVEFLDSTIELVGETLFVSSDVTSFSSLIEYVIDSDVSMSATPNPVVVGQPLTVVGEFTVGSEPVNLWLPSGEENIRRYTVSQPRAVTERDSYVRWLASGWNPMRVETELANSGDTWNASPAVSVCTTAGDSKVLFVARLNFDVAVQAVGEPQPSEIAQILNKLSSNADKAPLFDEIGYGATRIEQAVALRDTGVGDVWKLRAVIKDETLASCLDPSAPTTAPVAEGTEDAEPVELAISTDAATGDMLVDIGLRGDAKAIAEGGTVQDFGIDVFFSRGEMSGNSASDAQQLSFTCRPGEQGFAGQSSLTDFNDAKPTSDGSGLVTPSTPGSVECRWTANNKFTIRESKLQPLDGATFEVQVHYLIGDAYFVHKLTSGD